MNEEQVMFESARFQFPKNENKNKKERMKCKKYISSEYVYIFCI